MTVALRKYKAPHTPERAFLPLNSCRLCTLTAGRGYETTGEVYVRSDGRPYTAADRVSIAKWLRRLASVKRGESPTMAKGYDRDQALFAYAKAFPTGRAFPVQPTPDEMVALLDDGWFLSVSGNVKWCPGSKLAEYVNEVVHEIGVAPFPTSAGYLVHEPMRPLGKSPIRVPFADIRRFSKEFAAGDGGRFCIKIKAGYDTKAARVRRESADQTRTIARLRDQRDDAEAAVSRRDRDIAALTLDLVECREDQDDENAAREQLLDALHDFEMEQRP